jgi:hypothetical protein
MGMQTIAALLAGLAAAAAAPWASAQQAGNGGEHAAMIDCTCRHQGRDYDLGALVCLRAPGGPQFARCAMVLNNTSWQFTGRPCGISLEADPVERHGLAPYAITRAIGGDRP